MLFLTVTVEQSHKSCLLARNCLGLLSLAVEKDFFDLDRCVRLSSKSHAQTNHLSMHRFLAIRAIDSPWQTSVVQEMFSILTDLILETSLVTNPFQNVKDSKQRVEKY